MLKGLVHSVYPYQIGLRITGSPAVMSSSSSRHPPSRKPSTDSHGSHYSRSRQPQDRGLSTGDKRHSNTSRHDAPPPYEKFESAEADPSGEKVGATQNELTSNAEEPDAPSTLAPLSPLSRFLWPSALLLPFLTAAMMLYLVTCSSSSLRPDFCVLKIALPSGVFDPLFQSAGPLAEDDSSTANASSAMLASNFLRSDSTLSSSGFLSLDVWGWCLRDVDAQE